MANLPEITVSSLGDDQDKKLESIIRQLNEWQKLLTNDDLFSSFNIAKTGTVEIDLAARGTTSEVSVEHGQDTTPVVFAFIGSSEFDQWEPIPRTGVYDQSFGADEGKVYQIIDFTVDETNVTFFNSSHLQGSAGGTIRYYIMKETAGDN